MTSYFYEDFDHVKPYLPLSINMVFGDGVAQVQFSSKNKLLLPDLWYKKYFYRITNIKSVYFEGSSIFYRVVKSLAKILFFISFGFLGKKTVGLGYSKK